MITDHAEGTFECLRYFLGGDRPSQTGPLALFLSPIRAPRLEFQLSKGGMSRLAPYRLAPILQSLPPILHIRNRNPVPSCSEGSWGLSVQLREIGIFTDASISPSHLLRQRPSRYTIRAGRNLPDKEFRYLRTVIVTAAVYRGFDSMLYQETWLTSPVNLPAPGTCQTLYFILGFSRVLCFC
jgi:hypothetical protein